MKILVTGATGFVGRPLIEELIKDSKFQLLILSRDVQKAKAIFKHLGEKNIYFAENNDTESIQSYNPDVVLHFAALNTSRNDRLIIDNIVDANITNGVKLLDALSPCDNLKLFVNASTFAAYRNNAGIDNSNLYAASKTAFEVFMDYYSDKDGYQVISAILYSIYGGDMTVKRVMDYIAESINATENVAMTAGEQQLDFIHVNDVVDFYKCLLENCQRLPKDVRKIPVGTGKAIKIKSIANIIESVSNKKCHIDWGALPYRERDIMFAQAAHSHIWDVISWRPKIQLETYLKDKYGY